LSTYRREEEEEERAKGQEKREGKSEIEWNNRNEIEVKCI